MTMTRYLYNDGRATDIMGCSLRAVADAVVSAMPVGLERTRALKAAAALKSEFRGRGDAKRYFWATTR